MNHSVVVHKKLCCGARDRDGIRNTSHRSHKDNGHNMRRTPLLTTFCALSAALIVGLTATLSGGYASAAPTVAAKKLTVNKSYRMPSTGSVKLVGHGFGHGHGMSQYGAEGAARDRKRTRLNSSP